MRILLMGGGFELDAPAHLSPVTLRYLFLVTRYATLPPALFIRLSVRSSIHRLVSWSVPFLLVWHFRAGRIIKQKLNS